MHAIDRITGKGFLAEMMRSVVDAFDDLEEELRLPLLLGVRMGFGAEETAEILSVPADRIKELSSVGIERLIDVLSDRGVFTDSRSVVAALASVPIEAAPRSLMKRIDGLVGNSPSPKPRERPDLSPQGRGCPSNRLGTLGMVRSRRHRAQRPGLQKMPYRD